MMKKMLGVIRNFLRKFSSSLYADSINKTLVTNSSITSKARQEADLVSTQGTIKTKQINRLGFMEGVGQVPEDFNTMGSSEIESMFYENK